MAGGGDPTPSLFLDANFLDARYHFDFTYIKGTLNAVTTTTAVPVAGMGRLGLSPDFLDSLDDGEMSEFYEARQPGGKEIGRIARRRRYNLLCCPVD